MRPLLVLLFLAISMPVNAWAQNITVDRPSTIEITKEVPTAGVFMIIENKGSEADTLLSASSEVAGMTELHTMNVDNEGVMRMRPLKSVPLPVGGNIVFAPANDHIMMMDVKRAIAVGEEVPMTLKFEKAGDINISIKVMELDDLMQMFPPELSLENLEKMKDARERIDDKDANTSWLTRLRERFQNLKGDHQDDAEEIVDPETLPTAEEVEAMERMKQMSKENAPIAAPANETPIQKPVDQ